ncbi:MAG: MmcQ/YjbR family DNA-binding protein [Selenomonadaceae bacterium]|nr:MmcQ/YjbR family DNA-binding protein [Selenomonadaceae bacterium]
MIFKNRRLNIEKILQHGFKRDGEIFIRRDKIVNDFTAEIIIDTGGNVTTKIFDTDGELYTLHLVDGASGSFVGSVKAAHEKILHDVAENCFDEEIYSGEQALKVVELIREKFSDTPEFLWEKFPNFAVFRRRDNRKWYAVIMVVPREKLQLTGKDELEILNLRVEPEELNRLVDGEKYFRGWHMNKKSWMTLRLDGALSDEEIFSRVEQSYHLAARK